MKLSHATGHPTEKLRAHGTDVEAARTLGIHAYRVDSPAEVMAAVQSFT